jgi:hypothetical protein
MYAFVSKFLSKETEKQSSSSLRQCCSVSIKAVTEKTNQSVTHSTDLPLSQAPLRLPIDCHAHGARFNT